MTNTDAGLWHAGDGQVQDECVQEAYETYQGLRWVCV